MTNDTYQRIRESAKEFNSLAQQFKSLMTDEQRQLADRLGVLAKNLEDLVDDVWYAEEGVHDEVHNAMEGLAYAWRDMTQDSCFPISSLETLKEDE